jgi:hypothetical protein
MEHGAEVRISDFGMRIADLKARSQETESRRYKILNLKLWIEVKTEDTIQKQLTNLLTAGYSTYRG